jgi:hypothetical protein
VPLRLQAPLARSLCERDARAAIIALPIQLPAWFAQTYGWVNRIGHRGRINVTTNVTTPATPIAATGSPAIRFHALGRQRPGLTAAGGGVARSRPRTRA